MCAVASGPSERSNRHSRGGKEAIRYGTVLTAFIVIFPSDPLREPYLVGDVIYILEMSHGPDFTQLPRRNR